MLDAENYPRLTEFTESVKIPPRLIIGREREMEALQAAFLRPELCNVILLGDAGSGKTALVQGTMLTDDHHRHYREVDLTKMIAQAQDPSMIAAMLKELFEEVERFVNEKQIGIVLFIDEFHQIAQISPAAIEVLKPLLADSGTRDIRVIGATTYDEFNEFIAPNQALVERLQRISLPQTDEETTVSILRQMAERYKVSTAVLDDYIFHKIYEYTQRYIPASSQPRKSILILDDMIGWHRKDGCMLDVPLLAKVLYDMHQVKINFNVDAKTIEDTLNQRVLSQKLATKSVAGRLQICTADLNDKTRPMASFLFTGSTGVGKTEMAKQMAKILFDDERALIRFDMTEYASEDRLSDFRSTLAQRVWERPFSIVLFDEIEKAGSSVVRILMQVLDDGRLTNEHGRQVSFLNTYIIMTTNAGSEIYKTIGQYDADTTGEGAMMEDYDRLIRRSITETTKNAFPPELLGRIDVMVPFSPLAKTTQHAITYNKLQDLARRIRQACNVEVAFDDEDVIEYLVENRLDADTDAGGARAIASQIETDVTQTIAAYINAHPNEKRIQVGIKGDLKSRSKTRLKSSARIEVLPVTSSLESAKPLIDRIRNRFLSYQRVLRNGKGIDVQFSNQIIENIVRLKNKKSIDSSIEEFVLKPVDAYIAAHPSAKSIQVSRDARTPRSLEHELVRVRITENGSAERKKKLK